MTTENSDKQPTSEKTCKKRTVDWPDKFVPGNLSSVDYDKLELPDFVTKKVELWCLEWTSLLEIPEKAIDVLMLHYACSCCQEPFGVDFVSNWFLR